MAVKRVSDPQISPSGKWVLFSVTDVSLDANTKTNHLWIVPLDGSAKERQLTTGKGESSGRFSPGGTAISYTADDASGTSQIFLAPWHEVDATLGPPAQLTQLSTGADGAIWSPDSRHLLLTSDVYPDCSTEEGVRSIRAGLTTPQAALAARVGPDPGAPPKFGELDPMISAGLHPAAWADEAACNKAKDDAAAKDPVKAQIWTSLLYRHWDHFTGEKRTHLLLVSATDRSHIRDITPASNIGHAEAPTFFVGGAQNYAWAPDSKEIAYVAKLDQVPAESTNNDVFTLQVDVSGDDQAARTATKPVKISTSPGSDDAPVYSPDGKYLAFRSQARNGFESDKFDLVVMDRSDGHIRDITPASSFNRWIDEYTWLPTSDGFVFSSELEGEAPIGIMTLSGGYTTLTHLSGEFAELQVSVQGKLVASRMRADSPVELIALSLPEMEQGKLSLQSLANVTADQITDLNATHLDDLALAPLESFWFNGAGGTHVEGFLLRPPNFDPRKSYPVKFLMHGGPQTAWGDSWSYRWNWQLMAASGYVVIGINRRGSTGYGQKFVDEVSGDWGGRPYQDLMLGLDYAEKNFPFIDKARECALGASYGGYMADWVLTHTNRFQCIVTHDGMSDPGAAFGTTEELWFPEWEFRPLVGGDGLPASGPTATGIGGLPAAGSSGPAGRVEQSKPAYPWDFYDKPAGQDPYRRWSPMLAIKNAKAPTLIIHSQRDYRLDVSQDLELFTALQLLGVPSKFLYFPDENHWVLKPRNAELWNATVSDWCDRWTHSNAYAGGKETR
jgi:dipeptidyl aminopeptidase/acylaminoacyl peptidase